MSAREKHRVLEELKWHTDEPKRAYGAMKPAEVAEVAKKGFFTKELWQRIEGRMAIESQIARQNFGE